MAVYTLDDYAKSLDPNGKIALQIRVLSQTNSILEDIPFKEGNLDTGEQIAIETSLPGVSYVGYNEGVVPTVGSQVQLVETTGTCKAWMKIDRDLAQRGGNASAYRQSKWPKYMESMGQTFANRLFSGNQVTEPNAFNGILTRYNSTTAGNGQNVILAGGAGSDNASIVLVEWGENKVTGIYPKGSSAGLQHFDHGLVIDQNTNAVTGALNAYFFDEFKWDHGLCVADWRCIVRIANIDVSNLDGGSAADLIDLMEYAQSLLPSEEGHEAGGRRVFYMNRTIKRFLRRQYREDVTSGGGLTYENVAGKRVLMFGDTIVRVVDQLTNAETLIS